MPDSAAKDPNKAKSFAELLRELPAQSDTATLVGVVTPSPKEGHFRLTPHGGGEPLELPVEAVRSHSVLHHERGHLLVQLETDRAKVLPLLEEYNLLGGTRTYLTGYTWTTDHHLVQKAFADPRELEAFRQAPPGDPAQQAGAGLAPFVLATPHHAPAAPLAMQAAGLQQQGGSLFSLKEAHSDVHSDPTTLKEVIHDNSIKETVKDAIVDPPPKEIVQHNSFLKEIVKDAIQDSTLKEFIADPSLVEQGGTLAEGGGAFGPGGINQF